MKQKLDYYSWDPTLVAQRAMYSGARTITRAVSRSAVRSATEAAIDASICVETMNSLHGQTIVAVYTATCIIVADALFSLRLAENAYDGYESQIRA